MKLKLGEYDLQIFCVTVVLFQARQTRVNYCYYSLINIHLIYIKLCYSHRGFKNFYICSLHLILVGYRTILLI